MLCLSSLITDDQEYESQESASITQIWDYTQTCQKFIFILPPLRDRSQHSATGQVLRETFTSLSLRLMNHLQRTISVLKVMEENFTSDH